MNINKIAIASLSMMSASWINPAFALDLYVDSNTQQIYAAPGENRVKLGSFEKKEEIDKLKATLKAEIEAELKSKQPAQADKQANPSEVITSLNADSTNTDLTDNVATVETQPKVKKGYSPANLSYGKNGFEFRTDDDKFSLAIQQSASALCRAI